MEKNIARQGEVKHKHKKVEENNNPKTNIYANKKYFWPIFGKIKFLSGRTLGTTFK